MTFDLEVRLPVQSYSGQGTVVVSITINTRIIPTDFLSRIIANLSLDPKVAKLGWKSCDNRKTQPPRRLETSADVQGAFTELSGLVRDPCRKRPVYMEIVNLVGHSLLTVMMTIMHPNWLTHL